MKELLKKNREQIRTIGGEVVRIKDNLNRSYKPIKSFGQRMASDRFSRCFVCINIVLLVGLVVYAILKGGELTGGNENVPASPVLGDGRLVRGLPLLSSDW